MEIEVIDVEGIVSSGALLGTSGTKDILDGISESFGMNTDYFGSVDDVFSARRESFISTHIDPILQQSVFVEGVIEKIEQPDEFVPITNENDLLHIPPCMHVAILCDPVVKDLLEDERIDGFGIEAKDLPKNDPYNNLLSGYVEDITEAWDENGTVEYVCTFDEMDPELSDDEIDHLRDTREYIREVIEKTYKDPTKYPFNRQ